MHDVGEYTLEVMNKAKWYNLWILQFIGPYLRKSILEVGAGIGNFSKHLSKYGKVTGIDINRSYIKKYTHLGFRYGYGNIEKGVFFFKKERFDSVVCLNVLEHIKDDDIALKNIHELLNDDGNLILLVPAHGLLFSKYDSLLGHYRRYSLESLEGKLKKCGFNTIEIRYFNWWGALGWLLYLKILKKDVFPESEVGVFDYFGKIFLFPEKYIKPPFGLSVLAVAKKESKNIVNMNNK